MENKYAVGFMAKRGLTVVCNCAATICTVSPSGGQRKEYSSHSNVDNKEGGKRMTKNEETILNNLVKTLQEYENECFRQKEE